MEDTVRLSVRGASFKYPDGTAALSDIILEVKKGEFIGILGSNGSGKTTLLKVMDGILKGFEGMVSLDGMDIRKLTPKVIYKEVETRVLTALQEVDLHGLGKKSIHTLSFGQRKRACIAGLLAMGHEILLLDEPTAGLDPMGEYKMMNLLTRLNKERGVTIVMATHSVDLVPLFLHKLYILSKGRIVRGGLPEDIFTGPNEMENVKLRLPQIAELIYRLKHEDKLPFKKIPLTIGEARREILRLVR
jgi:cobalt/nickel transport system ATP-binding protein